MEVSKRDGRQEKYVAEKITRACKKAGCSEEEAEAVERLINLRLKRSPRLVAVDDLHDMVEGTLMATAPDAAKAYILFRQRRNDARALRLRPDGTALSAYIDASKYCRWRDDLGRREDWNDSITRNKEMHLRRYPSMAAEIEETYEEFVYPKIVTPSMRSVQFGGKAIEVNHTRLYNCSFTLCDRPRFFCELFYLLLSGCGVGYSIQRHHVRRLPPLKKPTRRQIDWLEVPDTLEGWARAVEALVTSYVRGGSYLEFIYTGIRTEGTPLVTSGGKAPGHVPLKIALEAVRALLEGAVGRQLRPIECHDICCHLALAVLSGGIRRSSLIALFSPDDAEMRDAKRKPNVCFDPGEEKNTHRAMANNSAVFVRGKTDKSLFEEMFTGMKDFGEPGVFFTNHPDHGGNPCGEIGMDPVLRLLGQNPQTGISFCNLTELNAMKIHSVEEFYRAAVAASRIGTLQAGYTDFPFLGSVTEQIVRRDALLGVGMTGIMNNPILRNPEFQREAVRRINEENARVANLIGINPATRTTTMKPAGTSTLSHGFDAPGHHTAEARRSFRRVTANPLEPVFQKFREVNPHMCEEKPDGDWVITFPVEVPSEALTKEDINGVDFMDAVFSTYDHWIKPGTVDSTHSPGLTHNVSCTVTVKKDDWLAVCVHAWKNRERISAMAFAPYELKNHPYLPREGVKSDVAEARWNELIRDFRPVDYSDVGGETFVGSACEGLACEVGT